MNKYAGLLIVIAIGVAIGYLVAGGPAGFGGSALPAAFTQQSLDDALAENKTSGKPLIVNYSASWCEPCQQMRRDVWTDAKVQTWIKSYANAVYVDVDEDRESARVQKINAVPTIVAYKDGKAISSIGGYQDASNLLEWLEKNK